MLSPVGGTTNMRVFLLGLALSAMAAPCIAQTVLKSEPLVLAPYEIAYVQGSSCAAGKVLKVTGAIRGLNRKRVCVAWTGDQASLTVTKPEEAVASGL
jgi:hypothetical protein